MTENDGMRDENDLRRLLAETDAPHTVDADAVIARARRRRVPQQVAAGALGVLALVGVGVLAVNVSSLTQSTSTVAEQGSLSDEAPLESSDEMAPMKRLGAESLNTCGEAAASPEPSEYGLELAVQFPPAASSTSALIDGTVTMTNTSDEAVSGLTVIGPTVTVSRGDLVVALGVPTEYEMTMVELQPGETVAYAASFVPVLCSTGEDVATAAALPAGDYDVSAAVDFTPAVGTVDPPLPDLVTGPRSQITLQ
ncbi:hypothetical protein HDC94_001481 [Leifsonia sp. AK011]|uniref:hypothetical protein n=1 Tax=Leifsonia sp. AK011 TaxID=2723075 RepID=UPI0015CD10C2|nr:hypothetical protein [Leifsonia sp. AK011]NYF10325.1 hypothetical protein [Leifsonia sp. AK011]